MTLHVGAFPWRQRSWKRPGGKHHKTPSTADLRPVVDHTEAGKFLWGQKHLLQTQLIDIWLSKTLNSRLSGRLSAPKSVSGPSIPSKTGTEAAQLIMSIWSTSAYWTVDGIQTGLHTWARSPVAEKGLPLGAVGPPSYFTGRLTGHQDCVFPFSLKTWPPKDFMFPGTTD